MNIEKLENVINRFKSIHGERYDYSLVDCYKSRSKVKIICKKHGEFSQSVSSHLIGQGCNKCAIEKRNEPKITTEIMIERFKIVHGDKYDYSKYVYTLKERGIIICKKHGEFLQQTHSHLNGNGCVKCASEINGLKSRIDINEYLKEMKEKHNNYYDYSKADFSTTSDKIKIICPVHGEFFQNVSSHKNGTKCPVCANEINAENSILSNDEYIEKANKSHNNYYDYSKTQYTGMKNEIIVICPVHGEYTVNAKRHLKSKCIRCFHDSQKYNNNIFIEMANKKHNNIYTYDYIDYQGSMSYLNITCKKHGEFSQRADRHLNGGGCHSCNYLGESKIEKTLINLIDVDFIENDRSILDGKEIDLLYGNIGIEVNGAYWHSEKFLSYDYHLNKTKLAESKGIQLLHFWDFEIKNKQDLVASMVKSKLGLLNKIYARKCTIKEVSNSDAKIFLDSNHLQGSSAIGSIRYGLYYDDMLVSLMTFSKSRYDKSIDYELIRFCNVLNTNVIGGASKLLKHFEKNYKGSLVSYANRRFSNGNLYRQLGFEFVSESKPNYFYIKGATILSRQMCQKHKLKSLLDTFDETLSETVNMHNNGYNKVFDCGNLKYIKK